MIFIFLPRCGGASGAGEARSRAVKILFWDILNWVRCFWHVTTLPMKTSRYSADYSHFLAELRSARQQTGLTQVQLAEALGEPQNYVSKCETGNRRMDVVELCAWVVALGGEPVGFMANLQDRLARHAKLPGSTPRGARRRTKPQVV